MQRFSEGEIREVLARAGEIHHSEQSGMEVEAILAAAEEAGLPREAVLQALQERLVTSLEVPKVGDRVFAESADRKRYVADVLEVLEGQRLRVRFLRGGERLVGLHDTQPFTLLPGQRVHCPWPAWGYWPSTVVSYDAEEGSLRASDNCGTDHTFRIEEVRIHPPSKRVPMPRLRFFLTSLGLGLALGGAAGALVTWLLMR